MAAPAPARAAIEAVIAGARAADLANEQLEFKTEVPRSVGDTLKDLAEAASCLANADGGTIVVGVADDVAGASALVGCRLTVEALRHGIFERTVPPLVVSVDLWSPSDVPLLVVGVPISPTVHAVAGRSTERIGTTCQPMTPERIALVVADRRGDDWSAMDSGVQASKAAPLAVAATRDLLQRVPDPSRRRFAAASDTELVRSLGVVGRRGALTNAGALLLAAHDPDEQLTYVYRRTRSGALGANEHLSAPLLPALQRVLDLVDSRVQRTSVNIAGGQQLQVADLPDAAVREAVVNAAMHRDHRRPGPIVVEHSPTRFAVTSPGPFLSGITPSNVLSASSRSRNPHLANVLRMLGLAERAGVGVDRMYAEMARIGHRPPRYEAGPEQVVVTLLGGAPNTYLAKYTASLPEDEAADADTMLVLLTLLTHRTITAAEAAPLLQRPEDEAQDVLRRLGADRVRLLEATRETATHVRPRFRLRGDVIAALGPAITYRRRGTDEYDSKIVGVVQASGEIKGRTVQLLFDLDAAGASRVLANLVDRGVLTKTSTAKRGPGVTYGPGPQFPTPGRRRQRQQRDTGSEHA